jgi:tetratricopeptide (TPR) repeat protein
MGLPTNDEVAVELDEMYRAQDFEQAVQRAEEIVANEESTLAHQFTCGCIAIDCGTEDDRIEWAVRGIELLEDLLTKLRNDSAESVPQMFEVQVRYNLSNGYSTRARLETERGNESRAEAFRSESREHLHFGATAVLVHGNNDVPDQTAQRLLVNYATTLLRDGRYVEASDYCFDCLRENPEHPMGQAVLAESLTQMMRFDEKHRLFHLAVAWNLLTASLSSEEEFLEVAGRGAYRRYTGIRDWVQSRIENHTQAGQSVQDWTEHVLYGHKDEAIPERMKIYADERLILSFGPGTVSCHHLFADDAFPRRISLPCLDPPVEEAGVEVLDALNTAKEEFAVARELYTTAVHGDGNLDEKNERLEFGFGY